MGVYFWTFIFCVAAFPIEPGESQRRKVKPASSSITDYTCIRDGTVYFVGKTSLPSIVVISNPPGVVRSIMTKDSEIVDVGGVTKVGSTLDQAGLVSVTNFDHLSVLFVMNCVHGQRVKVSNPGTFVSSANPLTCVDRLNGWGEIRTIQQEYDPNISFIRFDQIPEGECCRVALTNVYRNGTSGKLRMGRYENKVSTIFMDGVVDNQVTTTTDLGMSLKVLRWDDVNDHWMVQGPKNSFLCKKAACELRSIKNDVYPAFMPFTLVQSFHMPDIPASEKEVGNCGVDAVLSEAIIRLRPFSHPQ